MSYEGWDYHICSKGHLFSTDAYDDYEVCHVCKSPSVWMSPVDDTNGDQCGYILPEDWEKFQISPIVVEKCNLGHNHIIQHVTYRPPSKKELKAAQKFRRQDGKYFPLSSYPDGDEDG